MGEKLLLRSLDDVEGEVGFDGVRTRPLVLLLKELGGPKDCGNNWVSGRDKSNNGKRWGTSESLRLPASLFLLCAGAGLFDQLEGALLARGVERCLLSASNGDFGLFGVCGPREEALLPDER